MRKVHFLCLLVLVLCTSCKGTANEIPTQDNDKSRMLMDGSIYIKDTETITKKGDE